VAQPQQLCSAAQAAARRWPLYGLPLMLPLMSLMLLVLHCPCPISCCLLFAANL
jgi:hypothetical protein